MCGRGMGAKLRLLCRCSFSIARLGMTQSPSHPDCRSPSVAEMSHPRPYRSDAVHGSLMISIEAEREHGS